METDLKEETEMESRMFHYQYGHLSTAGQPDASPSAASPEVVYQPPAPA